MRIGEAAAAVGMTTKALRFDAEQGLLPPAELTALRASVAELHAAAVAGDPARCGAQRICSYL